MSGFLFHAIQGKKDAIAAINRVYFGHYAFCIVYMYCEQRPLPRYFIINQIMKKKEILLGEKDRFDFSFCISKFT